MSAMVGTRVGVEIGKPSRPLVWLMGWQGVLEQWVGLEGGEASGIDLLGRLLAQKTMAGSVDRRGWTTKGHIGKGHGMAGVGAMIGDRKKEARWQWCCLPKVWPKSGTIQAAETCRKNFPIWMSLMRRNSRSEATAFVPDHVKNVNRLSAAANPTPRHCGGEKIEIFAFFWGFWDFFCKFMNNNVPGQTQVLIFLVTYLKIDTGNTSSGFTLTQTHHRWLLVNKASPYRLSAQMDTATFSDQGCSDGSASQTGSTWLNCDLNNDPNTQAKS
ncbi:hypothetical protein B0H14DRAFT_2626014 [Mycena olivaceomarginata]|nr:hypothetical protein B0H14DRAFT_2626014 [Mycena olivaceomarginata]